MALTTEQEAAFNATGTVVDALVYIHKPILVFEAPLEGSTVRKKAYVGLEYGTPTAGSISAVKPEMLLQIDIDGDADGGTQRVRGKNADASLILVGRSGAGYANGRLDVEHGGTIRVYDDYRLFTKAPYISLPDGVEQYKDELLYPSDNAAQPPVANAGTDRLVITEASSAVIVLDALGDVPSFAVRDGATLASYLWDVRDGTVQTGDTDESELTVSFPRGARWISLKVTDTNGISHTTHRLIVVARRQDCIPAKIDSLSMTADGNAMPLSVDMNHLSGVPKGAKVLVAEIENYGGTSIGYAERFSGWLAEEQVRIVSRSGYQFASLKVDDVGRFLQSNNLFPLSINIAEGTGGWYAMPEANIDRFMHHILQWHTNALSVCGFIWSGQGETYPFPALTTSGGSYWDNVQNLARAFAHQFTVDSRSQLRVVPDPHIQATAEQQDEFDLPTARPDGVVTTLTANRYTTLEYEARINPQAYWLTAQAISASNTVSQVFGVIAPSNAPNAGQSGATRNDLLVSSEDEFRVWMGNQYAAEYGAHVGALTLTITNPIHAIEPALRQFVSVDLPSRMAARYGLSDYVGDRWTVESIEYSYPATGKTATYTLRKEIPAPVPARTTPQSDDGELVQAWSGFDSSIVPTTGNIIQDFVGMADGLTQTQLEQTLGRTWLKVGVGKVTIDSGGTIDPTDPDSGTGIGGGTDAERAEKNGGYYEVARQLAEFLVKAQTVVTGIASDTDKKDKFVQFVTNTLIDVDPAAALAWADYIFDTPDTTLPTLSLANRQTLTGDMYCADSFTQGMSNYITSLSSSLWDEWFAITACISAAQYSSWYARGQEFPVNFYSSYGCYLYPPETLKLNTTQIHAGTVVSGYSKSWAGRYNNVSGGAILVYVEVSGVYEDATYRKDAFYVYNKTTDSLAYSPLTFRVSRGTSPFFSTLSVPSQPAYRADGKYTATLQLTIGAFTSPTEFNSTAYQLVDSRSPSGTGTGAFTVTFVDLGKA